MERQKTWKARGALAAQDKYQFQLWARLAGRCRALCGKKKGADSGIDGFIYFKTGGEGDGEGDCFL